jgi:hypothetical protein
MIKFYAGNLIEMPVDTNIDQCMYRLDNKLHILGLF